ncbi:MAG: hypothetical protein J5613_04300 [Alphaproteobacteria bacterium]|nr:hypothetical protein [Alphaproteobacteria bacterium]
MKRFAMFLGGLLVLPAFGEVAPVFYDEYDIEYVDTDYADSDFVEDEDEIEEIVASTKAPVKISRKQTVSRNNAANRSTASRTVPSSSKVATSGRSSAANSSRVVASRTTTNASPRGNASRTVSTRTTTTSAASRAAATRATGGTTRTGATARTGTVARSGGAATARTGVTSNTSHIARTATGATAARASRIDSQTVLYNPHSRVGIRSAETSRSPVIRVASGTGLSTEDVSSAATPAEMDELAEMTDYCKAQYAACMDNYCNVLDENQGRCSCSANLKNYSKSENALKQATAELQEVAQKIQYIGLSSREVETLFSQTEAELTMQSKTDSSQIKTNLDKIKNMIIDVKSGTASSSSSGLNFDISGLLDFTIDSTGFDLSSFLGGLTGNNNNVSNQRGEDLFKTATNRCKANVLRACTAQGVDASIITNAYDLEIDKECIAYEKSLNESNEQMTATVRNAQSVLQKARLLVAQSKNEYDMRGCINALDSCMQDEFVCGSDYENCLDPSGRYIVNGEVVTGSQPGHALDPNSNGVLGQVMTSNVCKVNIYRTWDYNPDGGSTATCQDYTSNATHQNNAWGAGSEDSLADYIEQTVTDNAAKSSSTNMSEYLQNKIGYIKDDKSYGMCASVLNKCQDHTFTGKGTNLTYNPKNDVIKQYLARVLVQIKARQDTILADYAEGCITDISSCLVQNGYPTEEPTTWASNSTVQANIAVNACRSQIITCMSVNGYSIETPNPNEMYCWAMGLLFNTTTSECSSVGGRDYSSGGTGGGTGGGSGTEYTVNFSCGTASQSSGFVSSRTTVNGSITLPRTGCITPANCTFTGWDCGGSFHAYNTSYTPNSNNTQCTAHFNCGTSPTTYTLRYTCGSNCNTVSGAASSPVTLNSGTAVSLNNYCKGSTAYPISWDCGTTVVSASNTFSITANTNCTATCRASEQGGGGGGNSEESGGNSSDSYSWDSIILD